MSERVVPEGEVRAVIEARKELGEELEPAIIEAFVERIEQRVAARAEESERSLTRKREHQKELVLGAMGISVPLLAIAAIFTGLPGVIAVCAALAVIGIATAR
jgi:small-conductance mechanosensitive channel